MNQSCSIEFSSSPHFKRLGLELEFSNTQGKMKILDSIRKVFAIAGYLPDEKIFRYEFCQIIVPLCILLLMIVFQMTSVIYMVRHLQIGEIESSLYAGFEAAVLLPALGSFFTLMYHKENIRRVCDDLQKIYDRFIGDKKPSAVLFMRVEKTSGKLLKYAFVGLCGGFFICSLIFALLGMVFYLIRDGRIQPKNLFLPVKLR